MRSKEEYLSRVSTLLQKIEETGCASYDPFDALNAVTIFGLIKGVPLLGRIFIQAMKISPINIRPLLGIRKIGYDPKVLADTIASCVTLHELFGRQRGYLEKAEQFALHLLDRAQQTGDRLSWGLQFPYYSRSIVSKNSTNLFTTINAAYALLRLYEATGKQLYKNSLDGVHRFVLTDLGFVTLSDGVGYLRYYPTSTTATYNVNALAVKYFQHYKAVTSDGQYDGMISSILNLLIEHQNPDGSWFYADDAKSRWIDGFHTGYTLEGLLACRREFASKKLEACLQRGVTFYKEHLLVDNFPLYYADSLYPIDSQNCSQAIQTASILAAADMEDVENIHQMVDHIDAVLYSRRKGYYYYQKRRFFVNRIMYLRWAQAPMLLALTCFLKVLHD